MILCFSVAVSCQALKWPENLSEIQQKLQTYIAAVNSDLESLGKPAVNSVFDLNTSGATLGVTDADDAEVPESVEMTFTFSGDCLGKLVLRCSDTGSFAALAGACIHAISPDAQTLQEAMKDPQVYVDKALKTPGNSFQDTVMEGNGTAVRTYYAYYPNQYHDGVSWLQLTLIFPLSGYEEDGVYVTEVPVATEEVEYQGFRYTDDNTHVEVFTTATPEPDSPAAEN